MRAAGGNTGADRGRKQRDAALSWAVNEMSEWRGTMVGALRWWRHVHRRRGARVRVSMVLVVVMRAGMRGGVLAARGTMLDDEWLCLYRRTWAYEDVSPRIMDESEQKDESQRGVVCRHATCATPPQGHNGYMPEIS